MRRNVSHVIRRPEQAEDSKKAAPVGAAFPISLMLSES
jgi:hypothetical protein